MMNKILLSAGCILFAVMMTRAQSGRIGIGTNTPLARLHVADSNVLFSASGTITSPSLPPPVEGEGRRMMWYVDKAAFRAGYVYDNQWDKDNIGLYSIAAGSDCKAIGISSVAFGNLNTAAGANAVAMGELCYAGGSQSLSLGQENQTIGTNAVALGESNTAYGTNSFVMGKNNRANGFGSMAICGATIANGRLSIAQNFGTISNGVSSTAAGYQSIANGNNSFVIGSYNDTLVESEHDGFMFNNPLFIIGNGDNLQGEYRSNAMVVYKSGNAEHNGYTRFGKASEGAPLIKIKEISNGLSASADGGVITIPHGLFRFNIISLTALLVYGNGDVIPGFRGSAGYEYSIAYDDVNIYVYNIAGNSSNILNKPLKITIIYKE